MKFLKPLILLAGCWLVTGCGTHRQRQSELHQRSEVRGSGFHAMSVEHLDSLSLTQVHQAFRQLEAVVIAPKGRFDFHPDSGFSGQAGTVLLYRRRDTVYAALQARRQKVFTQENQELQDSIRTVEVRQHQTTAVRHPGTAGRGWWLIVLAIAALVILARIVRKWLPF